MTQHDRPTPDGSDRLTAWVREHGRAVFGYVVRLVGDAHTADDLVQEVFCRAWQARDRYRDEGSDRAYLLRIADRLAIDRARRKGRERPLDGDAWRTLEPHDRLPAPPEALGQRESAEQLTAAMAALSEPQRRTLLLRYYGQLEFQEIADILGCPVNTALSHARRGLAALRKQLAERPASTRP